MMETIPKFNSGLNSQMLAALFEKPFFGSGSQQGFGLLS